MMHRSLRPALLLAAAGLLAVGACDVARIPAGASSGTNDTCTRCHGDPNNANAAARAAPPRPISGPSDTTNVAVGAHQQHLKDGPLRSAIACSECHVVPATVDAQGHMGNGRAPVKFGPLATANGAQPVWNVTEATCASTYCHGSTLGGGANKAPVWTKVDNTQAACGTCHGIPPPAPHPTVIGGVTKCAGCHPATVKPDGTIDVAGGKHMDGTVQGPGAGGSGCTACHGDATRAVAIAPAPPTGTHGETATSSRAVGAHQAHLVDNTIRAAIACAECHVVPASTNGHPTGTINVTFGALATTGGTTPTWNGASCSATYCHGASLAGGANTQPIWTAVDGSQRQCTSCHGAPPPTSSGHPAVTGGLTACAGCHPATVKADGTIDVAGGKHMNGTIDAPTGAGSCTSCHGDATRSPAGTAAAPPRDTKGNTDTASPGVGAHQTHLTGGSIRAALACSDCHAVPSDTTHSGQPLNLTWGALATSGGVTPSWNGVALTCANYCHGASLPGGSVTSPVWNKVDGTQAACGACHGIPPASSTGHPTVTGGTTACAGCHPATVKSDGTIDVAGGKHINGSVEVTGGSCTSCHGDSTRAAAIAAAPPRDTKGNTATTAPGVGAHLVHLQGGPLRGALACTDCHTVPSDTSHSSQPLNLTWGALAKTGGVTPSWNGTALTCANYCHGSSLGSGTNHAPVWTGGSSQAACGTCHGSPPSTGHHGVGDHINAGCGACHGGTYTQTTADPSLHVNGVKNIGNNITSWNPATRQCVGCHGSATW
jgi:predicted CxxxxCH...CXXCH cytochrome family protein